MSNDTSNPATYNQDARTFSVEIGTYSETIKAKDIQRNWNLTSFSPGRRAESHLRDLADHINYYCAVFLELTSQTNETSYVVEAQRFVEKAVEMSKDIIYAKGNCASTMITGPARFPVERNRKRMDSYRKKVEAFYAHPEKARKAIRRRVWPNGAPNDPIRSSDPEAIARLEAELQAAEEMQEHYKAERKAFREASKAPDFDRGAYAAEFSERVKSFVHGQALAWCVRQIYEGKPPYASFTMTNNNANMKRIEGRIRTIKRLKRTANEAGTATVDLGAGISFEVKEDAADMRIRLIFDGKPDNDVRTVLKRNGMRWSPKNQAWQRQLTDNARRAVRVYIIPALTEIANKRQAA